MTSFIHQRMSALGRHVPKWDARRAGPALRSASLPAPLRPSHPAPCICNRGAGPGVESLITYRPVGVGAGARREGGG